MDGSEGKKDYTRLHECLGCISIRDWWRLFQDILKADPGTGHSLCCCSQQGSLEMLVSEGLVLFESLQPIIPYCSNNRST